MTVKVKVCGITRPEDAQLAAACGAAAIGINFWANSPRYCVPEQAIEIVEGLPPFVARVGVFVDQSIDLVEEIVREVGLSAVQLHGKESPQACKQLSVPVIKAMPVDVNFSAAAVDAYDVAAFLFDSSSKRYGGSGKSFDWSAISGITFKTRVIVAGGLTAENVGRAIDATRPYAVDVASGVETSPGIKDPEKIRAFFAAVGTTP